MNTNNGNLSGLPFRLVFLIRDYHKFPDTSFLVLGDVYFPDWAVNLSPFFAFTSEFDTLSKPALHNHLKDILVLPWSSGLVITILFMMTGGRARCANRVRLLFLM